MSMPVGAVLLLITAGLKIHGELNSPETARTD
jgi:hypothetical protein